MSNLTTSGPAQTVLTGPPPGLSQDEVARRRAAGLVNKLEAAPSRSYRRILADNVFNFFNAVIFSIGLLLVLVGRASDALFCVGVISFNSLVSLVQELRAKQKLDRIALLTRPKVIVRRQGQELMLDPAEVVSGDTLVLRPGEQVIADGQILAEESPLELDESLLSGESESIPKRPGDKVYSGSFCLSGSGFYEAERVGPESLANQLSAKARNFRRVYTPLQREVNLIVRVLVLLASFYGLLLLLASIVQQIPLSLGAQMAAVLAGLVPNGLFLAVTLAYALGAVRLANKGILVEQANAVESLSNIDVLCLDKTGTLTANRLRLHSVYPLNGSEKELRDRLGLFAASTPAPNPTIKALLQECGGTAHPLKAIVPFSSERKWSGLAFQEAALPAGLVLGAPEILAERLTLGSDGQTKLKDWTNQGLRVLVLAQCSEPLETGSTEGSFELPTRLTPLGLVGLSDELRPQVSQTLAAFREYGVSLKIISGDNPQTVLALAKQAGLLAGESGELKAVSGAALDELDSGQLAQVVAETSIFGRVRPEQKETLVAALQQSGHYVAMIGDGVNDVCSLKKANLGIAMESGSAASRAVAGLILLGDSFGALPQAFAEGQRIRNGLYNVLKLFMTRIGYEALLIATLAAVGLGFPYAPKQSSLLVFLMVGLPVFALTVWAKPGPVKRGGLVRSLMHFALPAALTLTLVALGLFAVYYEGHYAWLKAEYPDLSETELVGQVTPIARTALVTLVALCGLLLVVFVEPPHPLWVGGAPLSQDKRPGLLALGLLIMLVVIQVVPFLRQLFELVVLSWYDYLLILGLALGWGLAVREIWRRKLLERFFEISAAQ